MSTEPTADRTTITTLMVAVGGQGFVAQVMILRELMAVSGGSEVSAGIGLGTWIVCEAVGALAFGKTPEDRRRSLLETLVLLSAIAAPIGVLVPSLGPALLGSLPGEGLGIPRVGILSLLSCALAAVTHGGLFVLGIAALASAGGRRSSIGRGYVWEGTGTAVAAGLSWLLLHVELPPLAIVASSGVPLILTAVLSRVRRRRTALNPAVGLGAIACLILVAVYSPTITKWAWGLGWPGQNVRRVADSPYGKIVHLERSDQNLLLYNGTSVLAQPEIASAAAEQFGLVPLLVHQRPRDALVLGPGFSLLPVLANSPLVSVTHVLVDPVLQHEAARLADTILSGAVLHQKVKAVIEDPRRFLRDTEQHFDCIYIPTGRPTDLAANRTVTEEFFALCCARLSEGGILAVRCPGVSGRLGSEDKDVLRLRMLGLDAVFPHTRLVFLDFPLLLGSKEPIDADAKTLVRRLEEWRAAGGSLGTEHLLSLLDDSRQALLKTDVRRSVRSDANSDLRPIEVSLAIQHESRLESPWFAGIY